MPRAMPLAFPILGTVAELALSPDGHWIAFRAADASIKKVAVDGTSLTTVASPGPLGSSGIAWISDREILFTPQAAHRGEMLRVAADGGTPTTLTQLDIVYGERYQLVPKVADDGKLVLYTSTTGSADAVVLGVVRVSDGRVRVYPDLHAAHPVGLLDGAVVYVRTDGALMAVPFDQNTLAVGTPIQVADSVAVWSWDAAVALTADGTLLYQQGGSAAQLVRVDMNGTATVLVDSARPYVHPRYSPDGRRLAFEVIGRAGADIWTIDLRSGTLERLTHGGTNDRPEWSPDGRRVMYSTVRNHRAERWWQPIDGSEPASRLNVPADVVNEGVFTPNGKSLVYRVDTRSTNRDLWMMPLDSAARAIPLVNSAYDQKEPRVSPDGKWLAYVSNESGPYEVYVRPLAPTGGRVPVSAGGGDEPVWGPDSRHIYYRVAGRVMEASLTTTPVLAVAAQRELFSGPYATDIYHPDYDIAPDGKSFVMVRPAQDQRRVVMVINWGTELRRRLGATR